MAGTVTAEERTPVEVNNGDAPNWGECRVPAPPPFELPDENVPDDELAVFSGRAELKLDGNASFSDDISLVSGNRLLTAKGAGYDRESGVFSVTGEVEFRDPTNQDKRQKR